MLGTGLKGTDSSGIMQRVWGSAKKNSICWQRENQAVEHLPSKCEALSSNSSTAKKEKKIQSGPVQWLKPGILSTLEEEIKRITVQVQPGQEVREILSQPITAGHGGKQLSSHLCWEA
jgi:hypothetical protein